MKVYILPFAILIIDQEIAGILPYIVEVIEFIIVRIHFIPVAFLYKFYSVYYKSLDHLV